MSAASETSDTPVVQIGKGGATPTAALHFRHTKLADVSAFVKANHYSKTHPGGCDYCFAIDMNGVLSGAAIFGHMAGNPKASVVSSASDDPNDYRELQRLVLLDHVPRNSESRFIAWCVRWLKKNTKLVGLISFADPEAGHSGTIYRASGWTYSGLQAPARPRIIVDGVDVHPRMLYNRYGTSSVPKIAAMGHRVETRKRESKHRYIMLLRPGHKIADRLL